MIFTEGQPDEMKARAGVRGATMLLTIPVTFDKAPHWSKRGRSFCKVLEIRWPSKSRSNFSSSSLCSVSLLMVDLIVIESASSTTWTGSASVGERRRWGREVGWLLGRKLGVECLRMNAPSALPPPFSFSNP